MYRNVKKYLQCLCQQRCPLCSHRLGLLKTKLNKPSLVALLLVAPACAPWWSDRCFDNSLSPLRETSGTAARPNCSSILQAVSNLDTNKQNKIIIMMQVKLFTAGLYYIFQVGGKCILFYIYFLFDWQNQFELSACLLQILNMCLYVKIHLFTCIPQNAFSLL